MTPISTSLEQSILAWMKDLSVNFYYNFSEQEACAQGLNFASQLQKDQQDYFFGEHTLLSFACLFGLKPLVVKLIEMDFDVNHPGGPDLMNAAHASLQGHLEGHLDESRLIEMWETLDRGGMKWSSGVESTGKFLIHCTSMFSAHGPMEFLLDHGVDPSLMDQEGRTPLHYALWHGDEVTSHLLVDRGARVTPAPHFVNLQDSDGDGNVAESIVDIANQYLSHDEDLIRKIEALVLAEQEKNILEAHTPHGNPALSKPTLAL